MTEGKFTYNLERKLELHKINFTILCERADISREDLESLYLKAHINVSDPVLIKIAAALKCEPVSLI